MNRSIFHSVIFFIVVFLTPFNVFCFPNELDLKLDKLNNMDYCYCGDVNKILLQSDIDILLNNFDQVSFDLIKYIKSNNTSFSKYDPRSHYNLILKLPEFDLNYYNSFPFSHNSNNLQFYKFLLSSD